MSVKLTFHKTFTALKDLKIITFYVAPFPWIDYYKSKEVVFFAFGINIFFFGVSIMITSKGIDKTIPKK